jgi:hypothetical protein
LKHVDDYRVILMGVTGDSPAKRLSSQFIARFFSNFTSLAVESLEAMIDLCEDPDVNIRKQAIKVRYLPKMFSNFLVSSLVIKPFLYLNDGFLTKIFLSSRIFLYCAGRIKTSCPGLQTF